MSDSQMRVEAVFAEAARLFESKNAHYGDAWRDQGWRGNLSRILEKSKRLRNMLWRGGNTLLNGGKEHPRETALDMINTLAFMIVNMDDGVEWGHEPRPHGTVDYPHEMTRTDWARHMDEPPHDPAIAQADASQDVPYNPFLNDHEATQVTPAVGTVPTPGEEPPEQKPTPHKRQRGQGSGPRPRPVVDRPQA